MNKEPKIEKSSQSSLEEPAKKEAGKRKRSGDHYGRGTVSVAMILIAIAAVIILNLIVGQLPSNLLEVDLSPGKLYEISDATKEIVDSLEDNIELVLVAQEGTVDDRIYKFVQKYAELSDKISVRQVDPISTPSVLEEYDCTAANLVVLNTDTGENYNIPFMGMSDALIIYTYDESSQDYNESSFDADGQITSAINRLTTEATETVYFLTGHNEEDIPDTLMSYIEKLPVNYGEESLDLLKDGIPEECSMLVCFDPKYDLADDEYTLLVDYLATGGKVLIVTEQTDLANFNALMKIYGIEMQQGYLGDQMQYYSQYYNTYQYYCFSPNVSSELEITSDITTDVMLLYAHGMLMTDPERETIINNRFLWTSSYGFLEDNEEHMQSYAVGIQAYEDIEQEDGTTKRADLTVISCVRMFDDYLLSTFPNRGNAKVFENAIAKALGTIESVGIPAKSMTYFMNTMSNIGLWGLLFIGVIPVGIFAGGLFYWMKRRKK